MTGETKRFSSNDMSGFKRGLLDRLLIEEGHELLSEEDRGDGKRVFIFKDHKPIEIRMHATVVAEDGRVGYIERPDRMELDGGGGIANTPDDEYLVLVLQPQA